MKKKLIVANWKLNGDKKTIAHLMNNFTSCFLKNNNNTIVISPSFIYLDRMCQKIHHNKNVFVASQNIDINVKGAFTGEISILMLKDIGVKYVIIGHSERRFVHQETNDVIAKKFFLIKKYNLIPILCVGETQEQKKCGKTEEILKDQLNSILKICGNQSFRNTVIAYEPVWAIGTGQSAIPKNVQMIHKFIKNYIFQYDSISKESIIIQYGGSVNQLNAKMFLEQPDIDGLLIGSASLNLKEFFKIIEISNSFLKNK
ncbi:triose-phosphate isomerase [Buchnera aphidicola (Muscaphis stroyani)]|uniref:Triosephosphate isomerase n=1 Tax=Buchnera aphidicola (Muscaphis stroyani) TaxID=1241869 RepID=A0A4D6YF00_9GAMM|nr:triose-phosphate isomerase [Buchnera aphidicola]QCI24378.1 triose-phosphate isomerase [Buchnera aphidicola (Muscaphis stroyani)]